MLQRQSYQHQQTLQLPTHKTNFTYSSDESRDLDLEYLDLRENIVNSHYYQNSAKHYKIRLTGWIHKLDQIITNPIWKRNRNHYIKLIKLTCECSIIVPPFDSLPPSGDVPKLSKHQINQIIDAIERLVKHERNTHKKSTQVIHEKNSINLKPQDYWTRIKNARQSKPSEQSVFLGRFTHVDQKYQPGNKGIRNTYYSMAEENQYSKLQQRQNICHSEIKDKENIALNKQSNFTNKQTQSSQKYSKQPKRLVINLSLQPKQTSMLSSHSKIANQQSFQSFQYQKQQQVHAFKENLISVTGQNNTFKTQMFQADLSIQESSSPQFLYVSKDECDFNEELSERCKDKNQILNRQYFSWKKDQTDIQEQNPSLKKRKNVEIVSCVPIIEGQNDSPLLITVNQSQLQWQQNLMKQSSLTNKLQLFSIQQSYEQSLLKQIREQEVSYINASQAS